MPLAALGGILAGATGVSAAATTAAWGAIGAGTAAGLGLAGASKQANAAQNAAQMQTTAAQQAAQAQAEAAKYAADQQAKAAADTLAFQKQQAELDAQRANATQQGNYNQWAAREGRLSDFGQMLGLAPRNIPAYVPLPGGNGGGGSSSSGSSSNYQPLMDALNKGTSPQAAIDQFNKSQGLPNGASYAWRSIPEAAGGGVVEIPGGSYLSPTGPNGSWVWSAGDSGGGGAASAAAQRVGLQPIARTLVTQRVYTPALSAPTSFASYLG